MCTPIKFSYPGTVGTCSGLMAGGWAAVALAAVSAAGLGGVPSTVLWNGTMLSHTKARLARGDPALQPALAHLIHWVC